MFRADCRARLPADVFAELDAVYVEARDTGRRTGAGPCSQQSAVEAVHALVADVPHAAAVTAVRGFQAGMFGAGFLVRVRHGRLVAALASDDRLPLDSAQWRSLRAWPGPGHAAVVALHVSDATARQVLALTVGDAAKISRGRPTAVLGDRLVDPRGRPYVAVLHAARVAHGDATTVTAHLLDKTTGNPAAGQRVAFAVTSGPDTGTTGSCRGNPTCSTDSAGHAS